MTYRSLLVLVDHEVTGTGRVRSAIQLAQQLDCHLIGLAPTGLIDVPANMGAAAAMADLAATAWDTLHEQVEQAAEDFRKRCRNAGLKSFEAVTERGDKAASLLRHAHWNDMTILSQAEPGVATQRATRAMIENVVLGSARPSLVLPYAGHFDCIGTRVLVAWDDSREAARAVWDALPLLRAAKSVQVVRWYEGADASQHELRRRLDAFHAWLARQGVAAEVRFETARVAVDQALLARAADYDADLVVMGAYGHARWAERLLGGATRGLLDFMNVPVLMVH